MSDTVEERRPGRPRDLTLEQHVEAILALKIDASCFVEGATSAQLEFLRKPVADAGAKIEIIQVTSDEIYGVPGVRIFRREGEYDQL
jgi:hypothetical protein